MINERGFERFSTLCPLCSQSNAISGAQGFLTGNPAAAPVAVTSDSALITTLADILTTSIATTTVAYNPCDDLNCNEGLCHRDGNFGETATCSCGAENHGSNCEIAYNDCDLGLCGHGGSCSDNNRTTVGEYSYSCSCDSGYNLDTSIANSPTCTEVLPCSLVTCVNPSICTNYNNTANCGAQSSTDTSIFTCDPGYEGELCDTPIDNCQPDPCDSSGTSSCSSFFGGFTCNCEIGYRGSTCSQSPQYIITVTSQIPITITDPSFNEFLFASFPNLQTTTEQIISNVFTNDADFIVGSFSDYTQVYDSELPGVILTISFQYKSTTPTRKKRDAGGLVSQKARRSRRFALDMSAITGALDSLESDSSISDLIESRTNLTSSVTVSQPTGEAALDIDACLDNPCSNYAVCIDITGTGNTSSDRTCDCSGTGFKNNSTTGDCTDNIDDCLNNPCENGFTCTDQINNYICDCSASSIWSGKNCETDTFCSGESPCNGNGICSNAACTCNTETDSNNSTFTWQGSTCSYKEYCSDDVCPSNSVCLGTQSGRSCSCDIGYFPGWPRDGACQTHVCTGFCQNGGNCTVNEDDGMAECACTDKYMGEDCGVEITTQSPTTTTTTVRSKILVRRRNFASPACPSGPFYSAILKISIFWPKIILKMSKNDQIEAVGLIFLNPLYDNDGSDNYHDTGRKHNNDSEQHDSSGHHGYRSSA